MLDEGSESRPSALSQQKLGPLLRMACQDTQGSTVRGLTGACRESQGEPGSEGKSRARHGGFQHCGMWDGGEWPAGDACDSSASVDRGSGGAIRADNTSPPSRLLLLHNSHFTPHTSHLTPHTSHLTPHTNTPSHRLLPVCLPACPSPPSHQCECKSWLCVLCRRAAILSAHSHNVHPLPPSPKSIL